MGERAERAGGPWFTDRDVGIAGLGVLLGVAVGIWPAFVLLVAVVAAIALLAARRPDYAFVLALALFGVEGSAKILLTAGETPLPVDPKAVAAALLDLALLVSVVALASRSGRGALRLWERFGRLERLAALSLGVWLVVSLAQIFLSGDPAQGLEGFRLTQWYLVAGLGGLLLFTRGERFGAPLCLGAVIAGYAALRALIGPAEIERIYAVSRGGVTEFQFGEVFRTVGSFSGAVGLASYLVPASVFVVSLALLAQRHRPLGLTVFSLALVAIAGSQVRVAIAALIAGLLVALALSLPGKLLSRRQKGYALLALVAVIVLGGSAVAIASSVSPETRERAEAFVHPLRDESVRQRLDTWGDTLRAFRERPLGSGLGTVGASTDEPKVTADNSYLKVLREQGIIGTPFFLFGLAALCAAVMLRLVQGEGSNRPIGIAAFAGLASFLILAIAGDYVEQPGKVIAWTLLGVAVSAAFESLPERGESS